ncbi:hypothetical protein GGS20DRAFT_411098 [Poronia punctata]|nr:hypothetical protein GGS20DRAFT_411098 [Poronia punctata]
MSNLPPITLTSQPQRHPACCLSLSTILLQTLTKLLSHSPSPSPSSSFQPPQRKKEKEPPHLLPLLSIGSGTGLLEELLHQTLTRKPQNKWQVQGVEVNPKINIYLPENRIIRVPGTWALLTAYQKEEVGALMFVYPRDGKLVRRYVEEFFPHVNMVLWLGPKCDWEDTGLRYRDDGGDDDDYANVEILELRDGVGLEECEMIGVLRWK